MAEDRRCPECAKNGHDTDSNHLFLMSDGNRWCCNKKSYHDSGENYYEDAEQVDISEIEALLNENFKEPEVEQPVTPIVISSKLSPETTFSSPYRSIDPSVFQKYEVAAHYQQGELYATSHWLYDTGGNQVVRKVRKLPKDFYTEGKTKGVKLQLFGQSIFPRAKRLLVTEGEYDALSAYQMLSKYRVAVVSLPVGANIKALMDNMDYLKGFKEVTVCMDQDEAGKENAKKIAALMPHSKHMVGMSEKDANAMLEAGKEQEFISSFFDAEIYQPDTIVRVADIIKDVLKKPEMGIEYPWPSLTKATYGRRDGEGMYVGAGMCQCQGA